MPYQGNPAARSRLAEELASDPKERAELAMVIDLERNDLGLISRVGSVEVIDPGSVRTYATLHHLVARVRGRARPDLEWWELLAAMVPGGSVTGCPKHAAMSMIQELEPVRRGPFTGAFGVVAGDGDMEFALPIRTAWRVGSTIEFAAGCGVVWQSDPAKEENESCLKVARWLELVGCAG
jgi:anthranilate synthase component 1